jgi:hypothetical protein
VVSRLQYAFTVTYHYLFPMLTMGLAPVILVLRDQLSAREELIADGSLPGRSITLRTAEH